MALPRASARIQLASCAGFRGNLRNNQSAIRFFPLQDQSGEKLRIMTRTCPDCSLHKRLYKVNYALAVVTMLDRKSTRPNSSHSQISYAVFCLKKKKMP